MPNRRTFLQYGLAGAATLVPGLRADAGTLPSRIVSDPFCDLPNWDDPLDSRVQLVAAQAAEGSPLKVPPVLQPTVVDGVDTYEMAVREADVEILDGATSRVLSYDGLFPGPTIHAQVGRPVSLDLANDFDEDVVLHLHGIQTDEESDGSPVFPVPPGTSKVYNYPNEQRAATLWYHDHAMHLSAEHVWRGLAGLYLLRDPAEDALGLPSGDRDLPLFIVDKAFDENGALTPHTNGIGNVLTVNGTVGAYHEVQATSYRLRLINGANARPFRIGLRSGVMTQVASDQGLLPRPVVLKELTLVASERADVIVDFTRLGPGRSVELLALGSFGAPDVPLVRFDVTEAGPASALVPRTLAPAPELPEPTAERVVELGFDGAWVLNGMRFDPERVDYRVQLGATETWRFVNDQSGDHPMHLHAVAFQVQSRNGQPVPENERGWKDTVNVPNAGEAVVKVRYDGYPGTFMYHCHILEHEDHDMMAQFEMVDEE